MPSPDRWDKVLKASPEDRFAMLELAFSGDKRLVLSDLEIEQGDFRGSYVFLMGLKEKFPDISFRLLTGADTYEGIPHWRDPLNFYGTNYNGHLLLRDIELIVFARNGYPQPDMEQHKRNGYAPLFWLGPEQGFNGVYSSTAIRRSLLLNRNVSALRAELDSVKSQLDAAAVAQKRLQAEVTVLSNRMSEETVRRDTRQEEIIYRLDLLLGKSDKILAKKVVVSGNAATTVMEPDANARP